jgi:hypothetical protein
MSNQLVVKQMDLVLAKIFFNIANLLFIAGSVSLLNDFRKNPIKYKLWSAGLTFLAMANIQVGYVFLEDWLSIALAVPTVVYWAVASFYSLIKGLQERKNKNASA